MISLFLSVLLINVRSPYSHNTYASQTIPNFEVVGVSLSGANLYQDVIDSKAEILILDLNMPEKDGIEVIKEFAQNGIPCKVIILSSYDDLKLIKEVMRLGASGYLTKKCAGENIVEAIYAVHNGEDYFSKSVREKIYHLVTKDNQKVNFLFKPCGKSDTDNIERTLRMGTVINLVIKDFNSIPKPSRTVLLGQVQKPNRGGKE